MSKRKSKRESTLREHGSKIHWTSFKFPPRKNMKLDEILKESGDGRQSKVKAAESALKQLQQKAITHGLMKVQRPNSFFFNEEEQKVVEDHIL